MPDKNYKYAKGVEVQWVKLAAPNKDKIDYYANSPGYYKLTGDEHYAIFAFTMHLTEPLPNHLSYCTSQEIMQLEKRTEKQ
jgi:hypothetical protein